jgi:hypothetical protein
MTRALTIAQLAKTSNNLVWIAVPSSTLVRTGNIQAHGETIALEPTNGLLRQSARYFTHNASTMINGGSCGLPVLDAMNNLVGIQAAGTQKNVKGSNWSVYVYDELELLQASAATHSGVAPLNL